MPSPSSNNTSDVFADELLYINPILKASEYAYLYPISIGPLDVDTSFNIWAGILGYVVVSAETNIISGSPSDDLKFSAASNAAAYHLTFVGISSRLIKGLGVYSELGYGYNGIFNAGLSYTF